MKLLYRLTLVLMMGFLVLACTKPSIDNPEKEDPKTEEPDDPGEKEDEDFTLEITDITTNSAVFVITPKDETMTYAYLVRETSVLEGLSDEEIFNMDMEYFEVTAAQNGIDIIDYLDNILTRGKLTKNSGLAFKPDTEYTLYCYGLTKYKEYTTDLFRKDFRTENIGTSDCTFEIGVEVDGRRIKATIKPSDKQQTYWEGIIQESLLDMQYQGDINLALKGEIDTWILYAEMFGIKLEQILSQLWLKGDVTLAHYDLAERSNYILYTAAIDEKGNILSEIATSLFATTETTPSKNQFNVSVASTTHNSMEISVVPSIIDPYLCQIVEASKIEGFSETAIQNYIIDNLDPNAVFMGEVSMQGDNTFEFTELEAGTEYAVCVFGYETVATTALNRTDVTTVQAGNPEEITFEIEVSDIMDRSASLNIESSDITVMFIGGMISEDAYNSAGANAEAVKTLITESINEDIHYGKYKDVAAYIAKNAVNGTLATNVQYLKPGSRYIPYAVCVNGSGEYLADAHLGEAFTTAAAETSSASIEIVYDKHFNGDEMADNDYTYEFARGKALIPVTLKPSVDVAHSYFIVLEGDYSSEPDENLIPLIWKYGTADKVRIDATAPWNKTVTLCAIGQDADGYIGTVAKVVGSFTKPKASPVDDYGYASAPHITSTGVFIPKITRPEPKPFIKAQYDTEILKRDRARQQMTTNMKKHL